MSDIKIKNDGKGRAQSFEAFYSLDGSDGWGFYEAKFEGYGANEFSAKNNLVQQVDNMIKNLKRIKDDI